ncbi:MAG: hypothetical protein J6B98_05070 [Bacilli bacterium]|nr:hypothetical protein [Bacilli bacterium]
MEYIKWFLIAFIIVYLFYFVTVILQKKRYEKFKSSNQVMFFVKKYKLNIKKLNISKFIKVISFTNSLIIALTFTIAITVENYILILLIGLVTVIPLMLLAYHIVGTYFKKEENK